MDDTGFWEYIRDNYYYENNMNYIANALLVMLELTVVNQWHAITRMYIEISGTQFAYIYFYSFYFVSVLIVTNVLTAFIFDAFIIQFQAAQTAQLELRKKRQRKLTIERKRKRKKEKKIRHQAKKKNESMIPRIVSSFSNSTKNSEQLITTSTNDGMLNRQDPGNITFDSLDDVGSDQDVLDEFLGELSLSEKEDWHKWLSIAMLYEFDVDDVLKGVWLFDRSKTTADFYEQIYGEVTKTFDEYLSDWNEPRLRVKVTMDDDDTHSMNGADAQEMLERNHTLQSMADTVMKAPSPSPRDTKNDALFNITKENITKRDVLDQQRHHALSTYNDDGNLDKVSISGPKQVSVFDALSTAPQVGLSPVIDKKQADKLAKILDF